ncbi:Uma2 family endonuclease [Aerosakkonemataceae cyanobacterium BLCC-F154]|uniref:Uma2 family endonuclease n=1 Tax=Floridaenema fluviatile BLCC-F154 TaxID=3153640 RepID=A0ABV4YJI7_9CYAN
MDNNPYSEPESDIAVVRIERRFYAENHPTPADTFLLIEISDTTLEQDRKQKAAAYAKAGIADYWILDVNKRQVRVFREIVNQTYQQETILNEEATLFLLAFPEIEVQISRLFPF